MSDARDMMTCFMWVVVMMLYMIATETWLAIWGYAAAIPMTPFMWFIHILNIVVGITLTTIVVLVIYIDY